MSQTNPTDAQASAYAENFILYGDQSRAWHVAFPESGARSDTAYVRASNFHKISKVNVRIVDIRNNLRKQTEKEFLVTVSTLKTMLFDAAEMGSKGKLDQLGNLIPINLGATISAISEINRMDGNHSDVKLKITTEFIDTGENEW